MRMQSNAEYQRQRAGITTADQFRKEAETFDASDAKAVDRRLAMCNQLLAFSREAVAHEGFGGSTRKHLGAIESLTASQGALMGLRRDLLTAASDREAGSDSCPQCGQHLHDEIARAGHSHENGQTFNADPQYGFESRGDYQRRHASPYCPQCDEHVNDMPPHKHALGDDQPSDHYHQDPLSKDKLSPAARWALSHRDRRYVALESAKFLAANRGLPLDELAIRARHHAELQTSTFTRQRSASVTAAFVDRVAELHHDTPRPRVASRPPSVPACPDEFIYL